jgi:transposase
MHALARATPLIRAAIVALVADGEPVTEVARRFAVSRETVYKWVRRFRQGGEAALVDRPPVAKHFPSKVSATAERSIEHLRRSRRLHGRQIACALSISRSTWYMSRSTTLVDAVTVGYTTKKTPTRPPISYAV